MSTGAFIAPFAFLGTDADVEAADELFRNPKSDFVVPRGALFFAPGNESFAEIPGLEQELVESVNLAFAQRIVEASGHGRTLMIQATELDDGAAWPFDFVAAARRAVESRDVAPMHAIILASAGIPGVFPPREIDGALFVDGSVVSNIFYGANFKREDSFGAVWKRTHPGHPVPTMRYWVILNAYVSPLVRTVQPTWPEILVRSLELAARASTTTALRHLYAMAELSKLRGDGEIEVRWVAVPQSWRASNAEFFDAQDMRAISDEGMRVGADPNSWNTEPP